VAPEDHNHNHIGIKEIPGVDYIKQSCVMGAEQL
jgi:hypothetical protein